MARERLTGTANKMKKKREREMGAAEIHFSAADDRHATGPPSLSVCPIIPCPLFKVNGQKAQFWQIKAREFEM
jgi:hypothetical protein